MEFAFLHLKMCKAMIIHEHINDMLEVIHSPMNIFTYILVLSSHRAQKKKNGVKEFRNVCYTQTLSRVVR